MKLELDKSQESALKEIERILQIRSKQVRDLLTLRTRLTDAKPAPQNANEMILDNDDIANSFGILGPRGAGKSTILRKLQENNADEGANDLWFLRLLDCSLIGSDVNPGAAVLLHLKEELDRNKDRIRNFKNLVGQLEYLAGLYVAGSAESRALGAEWASSQGDHVSFVLHGIAERLRLREQLGRWLEDATRELGITAFVVLLDDFDLVHAEEVRRWLLALLDELRQPRFLIVLTADFYRLEHLSLDPEAEFDDKTGRALLGKVLPVQNRVTLDRWDYDARESFGAKKRTKPQDKAESIEDGNGLGEVVARFGWGRKAQEALLRRLLPGWPRGLVNLHARLTEKGDTLQDRSEPARLTTFLSILSSCRAEPLLARELRAIPLTAWLRNLRFKTDDISAEDWQEAVEIAEEREREKKGASIRPIQLLKPVLPASKYFAGADRAGDHDDVAELIAKIESDRSGVSTQDNLRHDFLRVKPLRDAQPPVLCFWAELLVNFGMISYPSQEDTNAKHEAIRNRIFFLDHWRPVQERLKGAVFKIENLRLGEFRDLFLDNDLPLSALLWMAWSGKDRIDLKIGWPPLLSALRRARRPLQREKMADLMINVQHFKGQTLGGGSPEDLELIPDEVWAIILLVDGLDRCPWQALSGFAVWTAQTHLLLAIALVRSAYVYALIRANELAPDSVESEQAWFVKALKGRDPWGFLDTTEEDLVQRITQLLGDGLEDRVSGSSSLSVAAQAFFTSPAYIDLRAFALRTY